MARKLIQWDEEDPSEVERLLATLIVDCYPGAEHIDGAGGDAGRDVELLREDGSRDCWEIKSFHERLKPAQKRQIRDSLRAAVRDEPPPRAWTLVLPLNLTPSERRWFYGLTTEDPELAGAGVRLAVHGCTWIENELARRPELRDLFRKTYERAREQVLRHARDESLETAVLAAGLPDLATRASKLHDLSQTIDPDWAIDFAATRDGQSVSFRPRHPDTLERHPLRFRATFRLPKGHAAAEALRVGTPVWVDADAVDLEVIDRPDILDSFLPKGAWQGASLLIDGRQPVRMGDFLSLARAGREPLVFGRTESSTGLSHQRHVFRNNGLGATLTVTHGNREADAKLRVVADDGSTATNLATLAELLWPAEETSWEVRLNGSILTTATIRGEESNSARQDLLRAVAFLERVAGTRPFDSSAEGPFDHLMFWANVLEASLRGNPYPVDTSRLSSGQMIVTGVGGELEDGPASFAMHSERPVVVAWGAQRYRIGDGTLLSFDGSFERNGPDSGVVHIAPRGEGRCQVTLLPPKHGSEDGPAAR